MRVRVACLIGALSVLLLSPMAVEAGSIGLRWDASPGATGYRVHYGLGTRNYVESLDVGNTTNVTLTGLSDCTDLYFAVTAYNPAGESGFSDEVISWTRPAVSTTSPAAARQGAQLTWTIDGSGFSPSADISIDNPNVHLGEPSIVCDRIQLTAVVEPTAEDVRPALVGPVALTVANPDGLTVTVSEAFEVLIEPSRFDINRSDESTNQRIDGKDTVWLARLFGSHEGGATYDPDFDFDGDGWIDGVELAHIGSNLGKCWNGGSWSVSACSQ